MDIRHIRYDGKLTSVEYLLVKDGEESENKCRSKQTPETSFQEALAAFNPLVLKFLGVEKAWKDDLLITGISLSESKAKGGRARMGIIVVCRYQPEGSVSPMSWPLPLLKEALDQAEHGKPGYIPESWKEPIEAMKKQAIRFVQGKRFQKELPFAKAS